MTLKSRIKTRSILDEIITFSNEVFKDFESDMGVEIGMLGNPTRNTVKSYVIAKWIVCSQIMTPELDAKKSDLWDIACRFVKLYTRTYWKDWPRKTQFRNTAMHSIAQ